MAAGDKRIGLEGAFLWGTAGSTPATETDNVDDVVLNMSKRVAEAVMRNRKWVAKKPTASEASLTFKVWDIEGDAFMAALLTAFNNDTRVALYAKDADSGAGLDADWYVTQMNRNEDNEGFIFYNCTAEPTDELRQPSWT